MVPSKAEYAKKGNVLVVSGKLDHGEEEILRQKGEEMEGADSGEVVLDLSAVTYIASACLGTILVLKDFLGKRGVSLSLKLPRSLLYVCDLMGIRNVVRAEIVD